ncbi:MAG: 6-phosphofructokinase [Oceanospirillaceae bacterium]|nr:6-phosphofructokinase [Oceanospirillaceae bacterium]
MYQIPDLKQIETLRHIGVLTSGGDSPGMNAAIRAIVRTANHFNIEITGIQRGYSGLLEKAFVELNSENVCNLIQRGGTTLMSARCKEFHLRETRELAVQNLREQGIEALIVIGGDGSLTGARLMEKEFGFPVIGLPGTIDNDIYGTEVCIGFDSALHTAVNAVDRIRDCANSSEHFHIVECMGRNSGALAVHTGIATSAELILIPEAPWQMDEVCHQLYQLRKSDRATSGIIVVAEGGNTGISYEIQKQLTELGIDSLVTILGHIQRGGTPSPNDRLLASALGNAAIHYLMAGYSNVMVGVERGRTITSDLADVISHRQSLNQSTLKLVSELKPWF